MVTGNTGVSRGMTTAADYNIKYSVALQNYGVFQFQEKSSIKILNDLKEELEDWNQAKILLELLKNFKLEKRKEFILKVINQALRDIFESDYVLDIVPRETRGKSAASTQKYDIVFFQNGIEIARNDELLRSNGGGVLSIASLFFKILIGYLYSKNKFYIFDEALSQVSPQFRKRLSIFLAKFCEEYGFTLVIVSQTEELEEKANLVYEVLAETEENGVPILKIDNIIGEVPKEDYFYTGIKNFQSIKDQTFIFKGFTIIRGPNNSGKSASLRAIESILFNTFRTDTYPRKNPGGKKLTTEIAFGFKGKEGTDTKEIGLKYKSGKVMFIIEGEEYFGKSLAADKVREAVEEIGFRYIDVKKMYKNFKGDLKEQTERIAYTNQHDGLFLIGAKTSDSEKIFSFLFNTENIALAIAQAKEKMQELSTEHKTKEAALLDLQEKIRTTKIEMNLWLKCYYKALVEEFNLIETKVSNTVRAEKITSEFVTKLNSLVLIREATNFQNSNQQLNIENKISHNNTTIEKINSIVNLKAWFDILNNYSIILQRQRKASNGSGIVQNLIEKFSNLADLKTYFGISTSYKTTAAYKEGIDTKKQQLDTTYGLCTCENCNGVGVVVS